MKKLIAVGVASLVFSMSGTTQATVRDNAGLIQRCWTPAQLGKRSQENVARWTRQDKTLPKLDALTPTPVATIGAVRRVKLPKGRKLVALTFDLCEVAHQVAGYDGGIVDYLRVHNVKATFFAGGKWMLSHAERAEQLMADGRFEIGTHGWAHINLHVARGRAVTDEILGATAAYDITRKALTARSCVKDENAKMLSHAPELPKVFRFPFGACHAGAMKEVAEAGLYAIQWDVSTGDPSHSASARSIARAVLTEAKPGSIIIAHANGHGWNTAKALPLFIPQMRKRGYEFVTVSELMAAGMPEIVATCYDRRPGDTNRYDVVRLRRKHSRNRRMRNRPASAPTHASWRALIDR